MSKKKHMRPNIFINMYTKSPIFVLKSVFYNADFAQKLSMNMLKNENMKNAISINEMATKNFFTFY